MKPPSQAQCPASDVRVAWLLPTMRGGYYWQPLFREFAKLFPNTVVFTGEWPGFMPGYEGMLKVKLLSGFRYVTLKRSATGANIGFQWPTSSIIWHLRRFRPAVLFTSAFSLWTACALVYRALTQSRVIVLLDGISDTTTYMNSLLRLSIRRMMGRFIDAAVCNSGPGCDYLRDVVGIPNSKILHRTFYVPDVTTLLSGTRVLTTSQATSHPNFLFIGEIIKRKGWNYLLEAVSLLVRNGFEAFSVTVVGDGEEKDMLMDRILSLGLKEIVNVVGPVPYDQLGTYFETADVFVLPTLEDTWGMVVSEAMAFGKAVLCSQFAGARELVKDGMNGYIFNPLDPPELAGYMERFLREPNLIAKFGTNSQNIIALHTPDSAAEILGTLV